MIVKGLHAHDRSIKVVDENGTHAKHGEDGARKKVLQKPWEFISQIPSDDGVTC
jgi:hypothetical protein